MDKSEEVEALANIFALIRDDAYACSFQTVGQYRSALLRVIDRGVQRLFEEINNEEALRLADVTRLSRHHEWHLQVDAELRRLHTQRDALLEALRYIGEYRGEGPCTTPWRNIVVDLGEKARAAIKAVEETK